jgi:integrase
VAAKDKGGGRTRANGEGSYRQRGKSIEFRWAGKTLTEPRDGRSEKELRDRLKELLGMPSAFDPRITLANLAHEWYNDLEKRVREGTLEESTYENYKYTLAKITKEFEKDVFIETDAKRIYDGMANVRKASEEMDKDTGLFLESDEKASHEMLRKIRAMLNQIFSYGVFTNRIKPADNPMPYVPELRSAERKKPTKKAYTEDEVVLLIKNLPETRIGYAIRLCIACSFRGQELVMLKDSDISADGSTIVIDKALKRGHKGRFYPGVTKSEASDRLTEVPPFARPWAIWLRENAVNGYILPDKNGKHITTDMWRYHHKKAVESIGLEPLTPHKLRHTATTNMRTRAGIKGKVVMAINGQSDEPTMERYNHVDQDAKRLAARRYDKYMSRLLSGKKEDGKPASFKLLPIGQRLGNTRNSASN